MKKMINPALASALLFSISTGVHAFSTGFTLEFDPGTYGCIGGVGTAPNLCSYGTTITSGSYFSMDYNDDGIFSSEEGNAISMNEGVFVDGAAQPASGSHTGTVDGTESPSIDNPWNFLANTGMHQSLSPITVVSNDYFGNMALDFSGWSVTWNALPSSIDLGGDAIVGDTGLATLTCDFDCSDGDRYTLEYTAHVPVDDPSGFGGVYYGLHLEGTVSAVPVPVPAAVWLFGSGLIGLFGFAKRRKI